MSRGLSRRRALGLLAGSPAALGLAGLGAASWPGVAAAYPERAIPDKASAALDVFQIKAAAQQRLEPPAWHFVAGAADDGKTADANRLAFDDWAIRVRRLVDVSRIDMSVSLLGADLPDPILLAPVGNQLALADQAELATARAAGKRGHAMICSTMTSFPVGEIAGAASGPLWFQLYASRDESLMRYLIRQAEDAGCRVLVLTVDSPTRGNREAERWFAGQGGRPLRLGNFEGYDGPPAIGHPAMGWEIVDWLRDNTAMKIVLKGIVTREDAALCVRHGVDGVIVSNHGGRQEESGRGTLTSLPEVVEAAAGRYPVLIDGGFRRGTDVFKALALGASAVCIGRPYLWGLGAFGEAGVARVLSIMRAELQRIMQFAGTTTVDRIMADYVEPARRV